MYDWIHIEWYIQVKYTNNDNVSNQLKQWKLLPADRKKDSSNILRSALRLYYVHQVNTMFKTWNIIMENWVE
jgi:hypothetical protein